MWWGVDPVVSVNFAVSHGVAMRVCIRAGSVAFFVVLACFGRVAGAQTGEDVATPVPTVTATPTPGVCSDVQACVDMAVPQLVNSCKAASSSCSRSSTQFALTATELADRAIAYARCNREKVASRKSLCNTCYRVAKAPLRARYKGDLFKGILGQAVRIVELKRVAVCGSSSK